MAKAKRIKKAFLFVVALGTGCVILLFAGSAGWAHGGYYSSTLHGNPTNGVNRDPLLPPGDCSHCHALHGGEGTATDFALWRDNDNQICFACHSSESRLETYRGSIAYERSIHESDFLVRWAGPEPPARMEPEAQGKCVNCHTPHGWGDAQGLIPSLLFKREEEICLGCHRPGGPAQKEIQTQLYYAFTHQEADSQMAGRHQAGEEMIEATFSGQNRHAECFDCHNVHVHTAGLHAQGTNEAANVLDGASFVETTYGAMPDTFPTFQPRDQSFDIQFEYQLCFKCHSYWAYGSFPPLLPSGGGQQTDQSIEFNPNNVSSHNVIQSPNLNGFGEFVNGWRWDSQMCCSDCHGSNVAFDPEGPHGSQLQFLLKAPWDVTTGQRNESTSDHLCFLCHDFSTYAQDSENRNTGFSTDGGTRNLHGLHAREDNPVANRPIGCMDCHSKIPHGINRRALLVTTSDPARLRGGTVLLLESDVPAWGPSGDWSVDDCTVSCHD
jgi:predicted CXXCH cytochrome family protein